MLDILKDELKNKNVEKNESEQANELIDDVFA